MIFVVEDDRAVPSFLFGPIQSGINGLHERVLAFRVLLSRTGHAQADVNFDFFSPAFEGMAADADP